jgi:hypothetical protein
MIIRFIALVIIFGFAENKEDLLEKPKQQAVTSSNYVSNLLLDLNKSDDRSSSDIGILYWDQHYPYLLPGRSSLL